MMQFIDQFLLVTVIITVLTLGLLFMTGAGYTLGRQVPASDVSSISPNSAVMTSLLLLPILYWLTQ